MTIPADETIFTRDYSAAEDDDRVNFVIRNSFDLAAGEVTLTLGACTGTCPAAPGAAPAAYTFSAPSDTTFQVESGVIIDVNKYVRPADLTVQFTETPTDAGGYVGQIGYVIEEE